MNLGDRRGGERIRVDLDKCVRGKLAADDRLDLGGRHRWHLVHEARELLDVGVRHQVGARREQLAELDERRAELLQRQRNSRAPSAVAGRWPASPISRRTRSRRLRRAVPRTSNVRLRRSRPRPTDAFFPRRAKRRHAHAYGAPAPPKQSFSPRAFSSVGYGDSRWLGPSRAAAVLDSRELPRRRQSSSTEA